MDTTRITHGQPRCRPGLADFRALRRTGRMLGGILLLATGLPASLPAQAAAPRVAIVLDQQTPRADAQVAAFERELQGFFRPGELTWLPPRVADGTVVGVRRLLDEALRDSTVSIVVALGPIGSHLLAHVRQPQKPAIATMILDAGWQGIPQQLGTSGVRNLAYVEEAFTVAEMIAEFHRLVPFSRLAILVDPELLRAIPALEAGARDLVGAPGAEATLVPAGGTADQILAALPPGTDAVYLTGLPTLPEPELVRLIAGLTARRLPTLSHVAEDVTAGALASYEPPEHWLRRARRAAVDLQRILSGEDAGTLPVRLVGAPRLVLNLATARAINFSPSYRLLTDAELVGSDPLAPADSLSLADAMRGAASANLDLEAAELAVESGHQEVLRARSGLLPRIESQIGGTVTREAVAGAALGQQPERQLNGGFIFSAPLYSEEAWAGYSSSRHLQEGREAGRDQSRLDVVLDAAQAYIAVLQARTVVEVRRSNLHRSRTNLETARVRSGVGTTSRADLYRWNGEVANARREVITAESRVRTATLQLQRLLNRPQDQPLAPRPVTLGDPALLAQDSTVLGYFADPARVTVLTRFLVDEALQRSPELVRADAAIAAQERQHTAAGRAFWLPRFSLVGGLDNVFSQDGAGSTAPVFPGGVTLGTAPDLRWQFRLQASLPIFTGFDRGARREQTRVDLAELKVRRSSAAQAVEQRVRAALETAASSYAAIALTSEAADAAGRNYELVADAYARGTASITALIDAQNAAENSAEAAANAVHEFLLDLMRVERAIGAFGALRPAQEQQSFIERLRTLEEQQ